MEMSAPQHSDPSSLRTWVRLLLFHRGLQVPDGRPLYAYRVGTDDYGRLHQLLRHASLADSDSAAAFCLYVAEWWRRDYDGGPWSWERALLGLEIDYDRVSLYQAVIRGLRYWKRPLQLHRGARQFFASLCSEGGLPLRLLEREQNGLRRFFRALLHEHLRTSPLGASLAAAEQLAAQHLPARWRGEDVLHLSLALVALVATHRGDTLQRDDLPLDLGNRAALELLRALVDQEGVTARAERVPLRFDVFLRREEDVWVLSRRFLLPAQTSGAALHAVFGEPPPSIFQLLLHVEGQNPVNLGLATRFDGSANDDCRYVLEPFGPPAITLHHAGTLALLGCSSDRTLGPAPLPGGAPLGPLPWVFCNAVPGEEAEPHTIWRRIGEGSLQTRHAPLLVAVDADAVIASQANLDRVGRLQTDLGDRNLLLLRDGELTITTAFGLCRIRSRAAEELSTTYLLSGPVVPGTTSDYVVYQDVPHVLREAGDGVRLRVRQDELEWRVAGPGARAWQRMSKLCFGDLELRHVVRQETRWCARIKVLPATAVLDFEAELASDEGRFTVQGANESQAALTGPPQVAITGEVARTSWHRWHCRAPDGDRPPLSLRLTWSDGRSLALRVPFPGNVAEFVGAAGAALPDHERVRLDDLGSVLVRIVGPPQRLQRFRVRASLKAGRDIRPGGDFERDFNLDRPRPRHVELRLARLYEWARLALASTPAIDAAIRIVLLDGERPVRHLWCHRYDLRLQPGDTAGQIELTQPFSPAVESRLRVEAFPLSEPAWPAEELSRERPGVWRLADEKRTTGSWIVVARDGTWCRSRPLAYFLGARAASPPAEITGLRDAVYLPAATRPQAQRAILAQIAGDPLHADWDLLLSYARTIGDLPPGTFEVIQKLPEFPALALRCAWEIAATAPRVFSRFWSGMEDLPFCWQLVPLPEWIVAARGQAAALKQLAGGSLDEQVDTAVHRDFDAFAGAIMHRAPSLRLFVHEMFRDLFGAGSGPNAELEIAKTPSGVEWLVAELGRAAQALFQRHPGTPWPESGPVRRLVESDVRTQALVRMVQPAFGQMADFRTAVCAAPIVAASTVRAGPALTATPLSDVRRLRAFDPEWFDRAYAIALTLALTRLEI